MQNNLAEQNSELVDLHALADSDIIEMLMKSDRVRKADLLQLCDEARRELGQYSGTSVA